MMKSEEEAKRWEAEVKEWRIRAVEAEQELREKCMTIANQVTTISEHEERLTELSRQINDMEFACHSQVIRA
jgi:polyhydroxyalkanoate synthesis regulator phasin